MSTKDKVVISGVPRFVRNTVRITNVNVNSVKKKSPIIIKRCNIDPKLLHLYKEDVIYETKEPSEYTGDNRALRLVNRLHSFTNNCLTIATYESFSGEVLEKNSLHITKVIGQKQYNLLFLGLCSIINQDLKIRSILTVLKENVNSKSVETQTEVSDSKSGLRNVKILIENSSQTERMDEVFRKPRRLKRKAIPKVVKGNEQKRMLIDPDREDLTHIKLQPEENEDSIEEVESKFKLQSNIDICDETSNHSVVSLSNFSVASEVLSNQMTQLFSKVDTNSKKANTEESSRPNYLRSGSNDPNMVEATQVTLVTNKGHKLKLPCKPEDQFHLATPEILASLSKNDKLALVQYQYHIDWKLCLEKNDEGNMPLHLAVLNNEVDLVKRQCLVLNGRGASVDMECNGLTALEISIRQNSNPECTKVLLDYGADPLRPDSEGKTPLHVAAESTAAHLANVLKGIEAKASVLTANHEELQFENWEYHTSEELIAHIHKYYSTYFNKQGLTPLMLACRAGNVEAVKMLLDCHNGSVNVGMPNTGNTALYLAISEGCFIAAERRNRKDFPDNYYKTVQILLENGAEPETVNIAGVSVYDLLQEFNMPKLNELFSSMRLGGSNLDSFILIKENGLLKPIPAKKAKKSDGKRQTGKTVVTDKSNSTAMKQSQSDSCQDACQIEAGKCRSDSSEQDGGATVCQVATVEVAKNVRIQRKPVINKKNAIKTNILKGKFKK